MQAQETPSETSVEIVPTTGEPVVARAVQTNGEIHTKKIPRQRHFLILFFFSFMWGTFGVDRMYMGLYGSGILKLITFGGLGLWTLTDMIVIMTGTFRDKEGRLTLQFDEYKKFADRTILWFTVILGVVIVVSGTLFIIGIVQLTSSLQSGGIPGLGGLMSGNQSQINTLLGQ
ncbi:MAG: NINE protein [Candidatus Microsaccharimonas sossegonensis]|uniref:NINE protein n=1 Tax=Candidatus Microsaccharimonas sossegonensis TaxID=2506948 RepID=A0A4Q0AGU2_9BACT|nr:MAG: NINE protein [Candidatus Microsaccharimonas sossegonensis]